MQTSGPNTSAKDRRVPFIFAITAVAIAGLLLGAAVGDLYGQSQARDSFGLKGTVSVFVDGKLVSTQDLIMGLMYDSVICKVFNDSTACSAPGSYYANFASSCPQRLSSGTLSYASNFYTNNQCAFIGVGLSTDTSTPTNLPANYPCPSPITTNGLAPVKATTSHSAGSNTVVLTATWTDSGSNTNGIDKACLFPYNPNGPNVVTGGSPGYYGAVQTLFTSTNLAVGQSFQIQWTFSF